MFGYLVGLFVILFGTFFGYLLMAGKIYLLLHPSELLIICSFILGGVTASFGFWRFWSMVWDGIFRVTKISAQRKATNLKICESSSVFSFYGGFTSTLLGVILTLFTKWGGDPVITAESFAAASTGVLLSLLFSGVIFQPLRFRFLNEENSAPESKES